MKKDRILIYENKGKKQDFLKIVNAVMDTANDLIQLYNEKQPWHRIEKIEDFESLYSDPLELFDRTLIKNIDIKALGGAKPDPKVLAELFQIDRPGFMQAVGYQEEQCSECSTKKPQSVKVQQARTSSEFFQYANYFYFVNGTFILNDEAVKLHTDTFSVYAESPEQIALVEHWGELCKILNSHCVKYSLGQSEINQICKVLKLQLSEGSSGKFVVNNMSLSEQLNYMR